MTTSSDGHTVRVSLIEENFNANRIMGNEVTKKDIDAVNKRVDAVAKESKDLVAKEIKSLVADIEDYAKRLKVHIEALHKSEETFRKFEESSEKSMEELKKLVNTQAESIKKLQDKVAK